MKYRVHESCAQFRPIKIPYFCLEFLFIIQRTFIITCFVVFFFGQELNWVLEIRVIKTHMIGIEK